MTHEPAAGGSYLTKLVQEVITESKQLRGDVQRYEESHRRERRAYRFIGVVLMAAILICLLLITTSRTTLRSTERTLDFVRSCTVPDGECYKANRAGTVDFREQLLGVVAVITDCDVLNDDDAKFRACVSKRTHLDASISVPTNPNK